MYVFIDFYLYKYRCKRKDSEQLLLFVCYFNPKREVREGNLIAGDKIGKISLHIMRSPNGE